MLLMQQLQFILCDGNDYNSGDGSGGDNGGGDDNVGDGSSSDSSCGDGTATAAVDDIHEYEYSSSNYYS